MKRLLNFLIILLATLLVSTSAWAPRPISGGPIGGVGVGTIDSTGTVNADEAAVWDDSNTLRALTEAEFKALFNLEAGTDYYSIVAEDIWRNSVSQVEMGYLDGVTSDIQTQINAVAGTVDTTGTVNANEVAVFNDSNTLKALTEGEFKILFNFELGIDVQAYDIDLTTYAGISPSANVQSLLGAANYAAMRTALSLVPGTDFYGKAAEDTWRSSVSQVEMDYLDGVTSDIQTQINGVAAGDVTGIDGGDAVRVDDGATATPEVNVDMDENTTDLEGTVLEPDDVILIMDTSNADDMARHSVADIALEDLSVNSAGVYGFGPGGIIAYASAVADDAAEPGFIGYDTGGLGADKADGYTGKVLWQMTDGTEDNELSDQAVTHMGSATAGTEYRHQWFDASAQLQCFGIMTHGDAPGDVAGYESMCFDFDLPTDGWIGVSSPVSSSVGFDFGAMKIITTGTIQGATNVIANAGATLAVSAAQMNSIILQTVAGEVELPDVCDSATMQWLLVFVRDASETVEIAVAGGEDTIVYPGETLGADDELDSPGGATDEGTWVSLICMETNKWYVLGNRGTWTDGGPADD
jgi:hypothetical protein